MSWRQHPIVSKPAEVAIAREFRVCRAHFPNASAGPSLRDDGCTCLGRRFILLSCGLAIYPACHLTGIKLFGVYLCSKMHNYATLHSTYCTSYFIPSTILLCTACLVTLFLCAHVCPTGSPLLTLPSMPSSQEFLLCRVGAGRSYLVDKAAQAEPRRHGVSPVMVRS